jgi:hypothetical protein
MSRASIVAMLLAAEVLIAGMALHALCGHSVAFGRDMHRVDFAGKALAPIEAGASPHVVIDDSRSRVDVGISSDGLVHVRDLTEMHGAIFSSAPYPQLRATRTLDGVRIERAPAQRLSFDIFGSSREEIEVMVPAAARLEIARCSGANVSGITGGVSVRSQDGHIKLADVQGTVEAQSDDGYLDARNVRADRLAMTTMDGHLALYDVSAASLTATTRDGHIEGGGLALVGAQPQATIHTDDGSIRLGLAPNADLTIDASTGDGSIRLDGASANRDNSSRRTIRLGSGAGKLTLGTGDGSIHILTNGALVQ